jgi:hypothetical protein
MVTKHQLLKKTTQEQSITTDTSSATDKIKQKLLEVRTYSISNHKK